MTIRNATIVVAIVLCRTAAAAPQTAATSGDAEKYFEEGEKAIAENRLEAASQAYEQLAKINPGVAEVHAKLGLIYYMENRVRRCGSPTAHRVAAESSPAQRGNSPRHMLRGTGPLQRSGPGAREGLPPFAGCKAAPVDGPAVITQLRWPPAEDKAVQTTLELSKAYPDDPEILYDMGHLFGDISYSAMKRLSVVAPDSVWVLEASGEKYEAQGATDLAIAQYRKVIALDPSRADIHFRLGHALLAKAGTSGEEKTEAQDEFQKEFQLSGSSAAAYEIGEIYRRKGQSDKALEYFALAIKSRPDFEEAQVGARRACCCSLISRQKHFHISSKR